jgi:hypothetical protein
MLPLHHIGLWLAEPKQSIYKLLNNYSHQTFLTITIQFKAISDFLSHRKSPCHQSARLIIAGKMLSSLTITCRNHHHYFHCLGPMKPFEIILDTDSLLRSRVMRKRTYQTLKQIETLSIKQISFWNLWQI